jgi:hypothetical protein
MEYVDFPTLKDFLFENKSMEKCKTIENKLTNIIDCMHTHHIYHNDLHENNILIDYIDINNYSLYIIDYGESTNNIVFKSKLKNNFLCKEKISNKLSNNLTIIPGQVTNIRNVSIPKRKLIEALKFNKKTQNKKKQNNKSNKLPLIEKKMRRQSFMSLNNLQSIIKKKNLKIHKRIN